MPILGKEFKLLAWTTWEWVIRINPARVGYTIQEQADLIAGLVKQLGLARVNLIGGRTEGHRLRFRRPLSDLVNK